MLESKEEKFNIAEDVNWNQELDNAEASALSEQIYEQMLQKVVQMKIRPGEKINIAQMSADLGTSRTPIRSAIERLMEDGLVEQIGDRSYMVSQISMSDCIDLCDVRKIVEGNAAYMAANNIKAEDISVLKKSIHEAQNCMKVKDLEGFAVWDELFHETIMRAAGNKYLELVYSTMKIRMNRYRYLISYYCKETSEADTSHAIAKHICILHAIQNRYSSVAQTEMEEHIAYTYRTLYGLSQFIGTNTVV